jgi:hypothetical protein
MCSAAWQLRRGWVYLFNRNKGRLGLTAEERSKGTVHHYFKLWLRGLSVTGALEFRAEFHALQVELGPVEN